MESEALDNQQIPTNLTLGDALGDQVKICRWRNGVSTEERRRQFAVKLAQRKRVTNVEETAIAMGVPYCLSQALGLVNN